MEMTASTGFRFDPMEERSLLWLLPADMYAEIRQPDLELFSWDMWNTPNFIELLAMGTMDKIVNIEYNFDDPKLADDIYKHWKAFEGKNLPDMERVRKNIRTDMREVLIDWIVQACEKCCLSPETLYLTINYIDRYLSNNVTQMDQLHLLGVACLMIAIKYEEARIHCSAMELVLYVTEYTYSREQIIKMEAIVLSCLQFELAAPTSQCFLRRFIHAAQATKEIQSWGLLFEHMASYIMELSLFDYDTIPYAPSLIAASAIFMAKYVLDPNKPPWTATLKYYTEYEPYQLIHCVWHLHCLFNWNKFDTIAFTTKEKYSQRNYDFVAMVNSPPLMIPLEYFSRLEMLCSNYLIVESDSRALVVNIQNECLPWYFFQKWRSFKTYLDYICWSIVHCYREINCAADSLAKHAATSRSSEIWESNPGFLADDILWDYQGRSRYRFC